MISIKTIFVGGGMSNKYSVKNNSPFVKFSFIMFGW